MKKYGSSNPSKGYVLSSRPQDTGKFDNGSEEIILPVQGNREMGTIMKTMAFTVEDEEANVGVDGYGTKSAAERKL